MVAGYFYPDDSAGITKAVEEFEKNRLENWVEIIKNFLTI